MRQIRVGDRVCPIMAMHLKCTVLSIEVRKHRTMMVGGTMESTPYVTVKVDGQEAPSVYRMGDLVHLDD